jgi:hypothetical protein
MTENKLFVDNPLTLIGLYGQGVFLVPEAKNTAFKYTGKGLKGILNVVYYDENEMSQESLTALHKIMSALKLKADDFALINAAKIDAQDKILAILEDFNPIKVIIWADQWFSPSDEVRFYQQINKENIAVLRCHSMDTVISDEERKRECWSSIQLLFKD